MPPLTEFALHTSPTGAFSLHQAKQPTIANGTIDPTSSSTRAYHYFPYPNTTTSTATVTQKGIMRPLTMEEKTNIVDMVRKLIEDIEMARLELVRAVSAKREDTA